jgi:rubrerythrin
MWDDEIKRNVVQFRHTGEDYAFYFLLKVQAELEDAIKTCMDERSLTRMEAIKYMQEKCNNKTLAKLIDEYNYMKYTKKHSFFESNHVSIKQSYICKKCGRKHTIEQYKESMFCRSCGTYLQRGL